MKSEYIQQREELISNIENLCHRVYPKDKEMMAIVIDLTTDLMIAEESTQFVNGMRGFLNWADSQRNAPSASSVLTTLIHDLGEFSRNRQESWFCPRTSGYSQFATN